MILFSNVTTKKLKYYNFKSIFKRKLKIKRKKMRKEPKKT